MTNKSVLYALLAMIAGAAIYWAVSYLEQYKHPVNLGWSNKARTNPFLAAEQFLTSLGIEVTIRKNLPALNQLPTNSTLFIGNNSQVFRNTGAMIKWMNAGGHIIIAAHTANKDNPDSFLQQFQVTQEKTPCDCFANDWKGKRLTERLHGIDNSGKKYSEKLREDNRRIEERKRKKIKDKAENTPLEEGKVSMAAAKAREIENRAKARKQYEASISADKLTTLKFEGIDEVLRASFSPNYSLHHPALDSEVGTHQPIYWSGSTYGTHFMQFEVGEGLLSVLSDSSIWRSRNIDTFNNAYLLSVLVNKEAAVVMLYDVEIPSLLQILRKYAAEFLLAISLWTLAWVVYRARRFGPIRKLEVTTRRSMAEHIYACADFLWRESHSQKLVDTVRIDTIRRIQYRYPIFNQLPHPRQIALLNEITQLSTDEIHMALFADVPKNEAHFSHLIMLLQTLWKKL